jgi:hypothetical protein
MTIEMLKEGAKLNDVVVKMNELIAAVNKANDRRGPKSEREMTDQDARDILPTGVHAKLSHKDAAAKLGLSYAQVYSCRKEFTFKHIHKEITEKLKKVVVEPTEV